MMNITAEVHDAQKIRPSKSGTYCAILYHGYFDQTPTLISLPYSKKHDAFNAHDHEDSPASAIHVDYWFDIPDVANIAAPNGDKNDGPL